MLFKKTIVFLALLGDPEVPIGVPKTGGFNKTVKELIDLFSKSDKHIVVITNKSKYNMSSYNLIYQNIEIYRIDFKEKWVDNQSLIISNLSGILCDIYALIDVISKTADICLIHSFYWLSGYIASIINLKRGIPFVHTVISLSKDKYDAGVTPNYNGQNDLEHQFLTKAKMIFAITHQEKEKLVKCYSVEARRIAVVGRSTDTCFINSFIEKEKLQKYNSSLSDLSYSDNSWWIKGAFLYAGRIVDSKGVYQIVAAWINAKKNYRLSAPLWLVGGTPYQISVMRRKIQKEHPNLTKYEDKRQIIWWGNLDSAGICALLKKSLALLMHSSFEAGGRVVIEAFSAGIPVIATPFGFAKDYIYNRYNGFIVDYNDIDSLTRVMAQFDEQPFLSDVMGKAAHNYMTMITREWGYKEKHNKVYDAFINNNSLQILADVSKKPADLLSYKSQNCVTSFPYFCTDLSEEKLSSIINKSLGDHIFFPIHSNNYHADLYRIECNSSVFILKHFYHILLNKYTFLQYNDQYVLSAKEQISKSIKSASFDAISNISFGEEQLLYYIIPFYNIVETCSFNSLMLLWKEKNVNPEYVELYQKKEYTLLKKAIERKKNPDINNLFCAEIALEELFKKNCFPSKAKEKIIHIIEKHRAVEFGLNYGKGVIGHICIEEGNEKLLPTHSMYLGELGPDIAMTFLQLEQDSTELWNRIKKFQNLISDFRLDLWMLILTYSLSKQADYPNIINSILDL